MLCIEQRQLSVNTYSFSLRFAKLYAMGKAKSPCLAAGVGVGRMYSCFDVSLKSPRRQKSIFIENFNLLLTTNPLCKRLHIDYTAKVLSLCCHSADFSCLAQLNYLNYSRFLGWQGVFIKKLFMVLVMIKQKFRQTHWRSRKLVIVFLLNSLVLLRFQKKSTLSLKK